MNKRLKNLISFILIAVFLGNPINANAHNGRTDSNGGHKDNKNVSGLGYYHYHCGGYPAHLHNNGICPYNSSNSNSSTSSSSNADAEAKRIENAKNEERTKGYNQGYEDGYNEKTSNSSSYQSSYQSNFDEGYNEGFKNGRKTVEDEKAEIFELATNNGNNDGYSGLENQSESYNGKHIDYYKTNYNTAYSASLIKRNDEILSAKNSAFIVTLKGENLNEADYPTEHSKEAMKTGYTLATSLLKNYITDAPILGQSLKDFKKFYNDKKNVTLNDINADSFINIDSSSKRKIKSIKFNLTSIKDINFSDESLQCLVNSYLTTEVLESYKVQSAYIRENDNSIYYVYKLKRTSKIKSTIPKNFYIIVSSIDNNFNNLYITEKEPTLIKKTKKTGKISI